LNAALPRIISIAPVTASQVTATRENLATNIRSRGGIRSFSRVVQLDIDSSLLDKDMSHAGHARNRALVDPPSLQAFIAADVLSANWFHGSNTIVT
jgi:hypothetical protein